MKTAIITLIALFGVAHGLKCFECNSQEDSSCMDPLSSDSPAMQDAFLKMCPEKDGQTAFCRKTKMYLTDEVRVHRDCAYMRRENFTCYQKRAEDHVMDVCQCDEDACNTATLPHGALTAALLSAAGAIMLARL